MFAKLRGWSWWLAVLAFTLPSSPSFANDRNFSLFNKTEQTVTGLWTSSSRDDTWHWVDGFGSLLPGYYTQIVFDRSGPCQVQLRMRLDDGSYHAWPQGINLCQNSQVTIRFNSDTGVYSVYYK